MKILGEGDLIFDFSSADSAEKFDDNAIHGTSTMKRVDFIAEYADRYIFLEVKDPDNPATTAANLETFKKKLIGGNLIPSLASKFRDSFWFRTLCEKTEKPIYYVVLLSMEALEPALLLNKQDALCQSLPMTHESWVKPFARACIILNLEQYKRQFGIHAVQRKSAGA